MINKLFNSKRLNNESGIILITVLMIIMLLMVLTVTMISVNVGQVTSTESEYRRIQATELAKGMIAYHTANQQSAAPDDDYTMPNETLDNRTFTIKVSQVPGGVNNTNTLSIQTLY